jgi:N-acyl amino acid synthase of PEP-CTERM/exosortase system
MQTFIFKKVEPQETQLMEQIHRLRFEVYCKECGFIKEENYPKSTESDEYDNNAVHFAAIDPEGEIIGTMRMILADAIVLPLEKHCKNLTIAKNGVSRDSLAEISRLVISKKLRKRWDDGIYYGPQAEDKKGTDSEGGAFLRRAKPMAFGLYRELYRESKKRGITYWYALMEKSLWLLLRIHGLTFDVIGEEIDVYGPVKPYLGNIKKIEKEVQARFPKFFEYFSENSKQEACPDFTFRPAT